MTLLLPFVNDFIIALVNDFIIALVNDFILPNQIFVPNIFLAVFVKYNFSFLKSIVPHFTINFIRNTYILFTKEYQE